ncbi:MAG: hypothetical protein JW909_04260 [Planctomycetes bacterium]|nr:hypothetical protein [Planctomycetota bacterium]
MPSTDDTYGILLLEKLGRQRPVQIAGRLAQAVGMTRLDAVTQLQSRHSFILPILAAERAQAGADFLVSRGIAAVAQPLSALDIPHGSGFIRNADPGREGLLVQSCDGTSGTLLPWTHLRAVLAFHRDAGGEKRCVKVPRMPRYYGGSGNAVGIRSAIGRDTIRSLSFGGKTKSFSDTTMFDLAAGGGRKNDSPISIAMRQGVWAMLNHVLSEPTLGEKILFGAQSPADDRAMRAAEQIMLNVNSLNSGRDDDVLVLVMGSDPVVISLVDRAAFNYDYLGERLTLSTKLNFPLLARDIAAFARPLYVNNTFLDAVAGERSLKEKVPSADITRWILERVLALDLYETGRVSPAVAAAIGDDESLLTYLE